METVVTAKIVQGDRHIIETGSRVVDRQSAPILFAYDSAELLVEFDLDEPFRRPNGVTAKPLFDENAVSPADSYTLPKVRRLGVATVEYFLTPTDEPKGPDPYGLGLTVQSSYVLSYTVSLPAIGRTTTPPAAFDWRGPAAPRATQPEYRDPNLMTFEERQAWFKEQTNGFFEQPAASRPQPNSLDLARARFAARQQPR